jgi:hypothetical protein
MIWKRKSGFARKCLLLEPIRSSGRIDALCHSPWIICPGHRRHGQRADAIAAHVHLLGLRELPVVCAFVDDVVGGKALGTVQLMRLQLAQANVDDHIGGAFYHDSHKCQPILGRDRRRRAAAAADVLRAVVADQECRNLECGA